MNTILKRTGVLAILAAHWAAPTKAAPTTSDVTPKRELSSSERARLNHDEKVSASRLKTLARAALQLAKANNDRLVLTNRDFAQQLQPFLAKTKTPTKDHSTKGYAFNDNLRRVWTYELQQPQDIVLFYEGKNRKLRFRATGWSVVAFADGSVRSVTRLQAQKLRWWKDRVLDDTERAPLSSLVDQTTPEKTAQSFVDALNRGRFDLARQCIVGAKPLAKEISLDDDISSASATDLSSDDKTPENEEINEEIEAVRFSDKVPVGWDKTRFALNIKSLDAQDIADALSLVKYQVKLGDSAFFDGGQTAFVRDSSEENLWRIAPANPQSFAPFKIHSPKTLRLAEHGIVYDDEAPQARSERERAQEKRRSQGVLSMIAASLLDDQAAPMDSMWDAVMEKLRLESLSNLRQIGTGAMQFVQEWDEKFAFDPSNFQEKIFPYLQDRSLYASPASGKPYSMNPAMANRNLASIASPSQTVLFYEGTGGALDFRYNGTANVSFVDGHVSSVTAEHAAYLVWNPPVIEVAPAPNVAPAPDVAPIPGDYND